MSSADPGRRPVVIGVPVYGQLELVKRGVQAIDRETPVEIELIVIDDCGPQRLEESELAGWLSSGRGWRLISHQSNVGFVGSVNELFESNPEADALIVNSDVEVLPGWFEALNAAMSSSVRAASASSLATEGSLLSVPELAGAGAAELALARASSPVAVEIPVAVAHCTWFSRAALTAIGDLDRAFDPGYGEEVDWSLRAARGGWIHLAALHSFVRHEGGASFGGGVRFWSLARRHELRLLSRYPVRWWRIRRFVADQNTEFAHAHKQIRRLLVTR